MLSGRPFHSVGAATSNYRFPKGLFGIVPHVLNDKWSPLVQEIGWHRQGTKPFSEAMLTKTPDAKWQRSASMC